MADKQVLIRGLDEAVREVLAYFEGAGRTSTAKVDKWQARDVLQHFIYFHDATAWGIQSAAQGGGPWPLPAGTDHINDVCRKLHEHEGLGPNVFGRRARTVGRRHEPHLQAGLRADGLPAADTGDRRRAVPRTAHRR